MGLHSEEISITTDASGDATAYSTGVSGRIHRVVFDRGTFTSGDVDFTITADTHGDDILAMTNISAATTSKYPRVVLHGKTGLATDPDQFDNVIIQSDDRVKIVIADGGNALTGSVTIYYEA